MTDINENNEEIVDMDEVVSQELDLDESPTDLTKDKLSKSIQDIHYEDN